MRGVKRLIFCFPLIAALSWSPPALGQQPDRGAAGPQPIKVTLLVDGAVNPELVPDEVAYLHFLRVLSRNPGGNPAFEERRRKAYLRHFFPSCSAGQPTEDRSLNESQILTVLAIVDRLMPGLDAAQARVAATRSDAQRDAAKVELQKVLSQAIDDLMLSVGPDAAPKIRRHVSDHARRRIQPISEQMPQEAQ